MKKKIGLLAGLVPLLIGTFSLGVYAASDIRLIVNGKQVNADIQIIDATSYVPLRAISELLGANVKWDEGSRTITINDKNLPFLRSYDVSVDITSGPLTMTISKVTLDSSYAKDKYTAPIKAVILDVAIENISDNTISWYPTRGSLYLDTNEKAEASRSAYYSDPVDGVFEGRMKKKGKIVVQVSSNLDEITKINFLMDGATDGHTFKSVQTNPIVLPITK